MAPPPGAAKLTSRWRSSSRNLLSARSFFAKTDATWSRRQAWPERGRRRASGGEDGGGREEGEGK